MRSPLTNSVDFERALANAGYDVQLTSFEGGHHAPSIEISLQVLNEVLGL